MKSSELSDDMFSADRWCVEDKRMICSGRIHGCLLYTSGFAPRFGGEVEVVVFAAVFEFPQSLTDSFVGESADPQAHERSEMCIRDSRAGASPACDGRHAA